MPFVVTFIISLWKTNLHLQSILRFSFVFLITINYQVNTNTLDNYESFIESNPIVTDFSSWLKKNNKKDDGVFGNF